MTTGPVDERGPVLGSVCTGYGGLDLGVLAAFGGRVAWVADPDPHVARVLAARMPGIPNLGDLRDIDWARVERVDVMVAGFPCQDISAAGKRAGIEKGARSGLWTDIVAGVRLLRPALVVVENVAALRWRGGGLHRVLGDLAQAGYDAAWRSVRAADIGAPHRRERVFVLAWPYPARPKPARPGRCDCGITPPCREARGGDGGGGDVADADRTRRLVEWHQRRQPYGWAVTAGPAAAAAHTDRGGLTLSSDPDGAQPRPIHPGRLRHAHRPSPDAHHPDAHHSTRPGQPGSDITTRTDISRAAGTTAGVVAGIVTAVAHADRLRRQELHAPHTHRGTIAARPGAAAADPASHRRDQGLPGTTGVQGRPDAALRGHPDPHPTRPDHAGERARVAPARRHLLALPDTDRAAGSDAETGPVAPPPATVDWGVYEVAIRRWEAVLDRPVPHPTQTGTHGRPVLAPVFVEHLMGLPPGWVTNLDLPRTAQLRVLGNGVVPQQAAHAIGLLLTDLADLLDADATPIAAPPIAA